MTTFRPLGARVLVRLDDPSAYESDDHNDEIRGAVLVVGPGDRCGTGSLMPMNVGIGDCVLFSRYSGTMVDAEDKSLVVVHQDDLLGVFED